MTYDSGYMVTVRLYFRTLYEIFGPERCIVTSLGKFDLYLHYLSDGWYIKFDSKPLRIFS